MANEYDIIIIRNGLRSELTSTSLQTAEMGFSTDTNQLYIGTENEVNEVIFDPFANAHAIIQSWLNANGYTALTVDEDLVIRNVLDVDQLMNDLLQSASFAYYARPRRNVEVITENSFNQMFADQHLSSLSNATGLRSSLFAKTMLDTSGNFLSYDKNVCTTFFIDYSLKQTDNSITYVRAGTLKIINGVPQGIAKSKLTDDNTEIWQDDGDDIAETDEFSNITFTSAINGEQLEINYTQSANFVTEVYYTVKRWSM